MSSTAWVITIGYAVLTIIGVAAALVIFRSTRVGFRVRIVPRETLERRESLWGVAVVAFLVVVLGGTIFQIPYWDDNSDAKTPQSMQHRGAAVRVDDRSRRACARTSRRASRCAPRTSTTRSASTTPTTCWSSR